MIQILAGVFLPKVTKLYPRALRWRVGVFERRDDGTAMKDKKRILDEMQSAIEQMHNCSATHLSSVYVTEISRGKIVWEGYVEDFLLVGHPDARRCFCWRHAEPEQLTMILGLPPVDSPEAAVKVAVAKQLKKET